MSTAWFVRLGLVFAAASFIVAKHLRLDSSQDIQNSAQTCEGSGGLAARFQRRYHHSDL